jgi:hypothetical protein
VTERFARANPAISDRFGYWFDFGDDWWHGIEVLAIDESVPSGRLPRIA